MYKPLPDGITIKYSKIQGLGLYATADIQANCFIGLTHIKDKDFENGYIRTPLGGFYNHSKDPNCYLKPRLIYFCASTDHKRLVTTVMELYALEDIPKDTEITTEYTLYEMDS